MNSDELRALADALEPMAKAPRFEDFDVPAFCAWVRACADAQPVAEVNDRYSRDGYNDEISVLLPVGTKLYTQPAAPQAEPETFESELRSFAQTPEQAEFVEKVLAAEPRSEPFMPHARCGTPDEWGRAVEQAAYAAAYRAVKARDTGDMTREDMEARRCADAIRSLMEQPTPCSRLGSQHD